MATQDQRQHIVALQTALIDRAVQVGYVKLRPMATASLYEQPLMTAFTKHPSQKVISPDCSEMVTMICRMCGLQSPSGPSFPYPSGDGNSETMWQYLPHYSNPAGAQAGAIVAYGTSGDLHVAMVMEPDGTSNPWLFSHGGTNGPIRVRYNDLLASFPTGTPVTLLNIAGS
jgi:hypothetical protein